MPRKRPIRPIVDDESSDDEPLSKKFSPSKVSENASKSINDDDSSSDSDIEKYLQPVNKIDFSSSFFDTKNEQFKEDENTASIILQLSNSNSEEDKESKLVACTLPKLNFEELNEHTKKMEEARKHVEQYTLRKQLEAEQIDIGNLLAAGESNLNNSQIDKLLDGDALHSSDYESCDSEQEGWEEVRIKEPKDPKPKRESLQITVQMPDAVKKKKGVDLMAALKRRLNRIRKENQVLIHKVHLLCWIAHGNYVSTSINNEDVLAAALSLLPSAQCYPKDRPDLGYLEQILKWFKKTIKNVEKIKPKQVSLNELLQQQMEKKEVYNKKMLVFVFVAIMRALGLQCRVVFSFQIEPLKPPTSEIHSLSTKTEETKPQKRKSEELKEKSLPTKKRAKSVNFATEKAPPKIRSKSTHENITKKLPSKGTKSEDPKKRKMQEKTEKLPSKGAKSEDPKKKSVQEKLPPKTRAKSEQNQKSEEEPKKQTRTRSSTTVKAEETKTKTTKTIKKTLIKIKLPKTKKVPQVDGGFDTSDDEVFLQLDGATDPGPSKPNLKNLKPTRNQSKRIQSKSTKIADSDSEEEFTSTRKNTLRPSKFFGKTKTLDVRKDIVQLVTRLVSDTKEIKKKAHASDDEFVPKIKVKQRVQVKASRKVLSSDEEGTGKKKGVDVWAEVFLEAEEKWISVDVVKGQLHCIREIYTRATSPVSYIVGWNNNNTLKDITSRYCQNFNTVIRKLRTNAQWWEQSLRPYLGQKTARDREEDEDLQKQQLDKPLPTSIAEYKNHPLYVLQRHLLKFQGIYPPDVAPMGFVRKEPVYPRECVYTLHSREIWLKSAKVVKLGEEPYKIVKARPKWDKLSNKMITDQLLEIFGPWQTEDYVPPTAENGVVPRNAFGNVELFMECMLPKKTVHLRLNGLNKVAKKMNIDCAAAVVGFDFHSGWSHPTFDGFVVCEEFEDVLIKAWGIDQLEMEKREQEKLDKRVYGNWKKLIKGLLIRERLENKYQFGAPETSQGKKVKGPRVATKKN